jgi:hypothetical protein
LDLTYFFAGQQSKENVASAWLATLLRFDEGFLRSFLELIPVDPQIDQAGDWTVKVEQGFTGQAGAVDVTLESTAGTFILIENKLGASAVTEQQLVHYYLGAIRDHSGERVIAVYLVPRATLAEPELTLVENEPEFARRAGANADAATALVWTDDAFKRRVNSTVMRLGPELRWFGLTGFESIQSVIGRRATGREPDPLRKELSIIIKRARVHLSRTPGRPKLRRWSSIGYESIYNEKSLVTMFLVVHFDEEEEPPNRLIDVVKGDLVRASVYVSFAPSSTGLKDGRVMAAWDDLVAREPIELPGLGMVPVRQGLTFRHDEPSAWRTKAELEELLVRLGDPVLSFITPYLTDASGPASGVPAPRD